MSDTKEKYWLFEKQYNHYDLTGEYGVGYTNKGEEFYFDLEDYDKIKDYCWHLDKDGYLRTNINLDDGKRTMILMHSLIMNTIGQQNIMPDHINGKETRHDNRKSNLRIATKSQNNINQPIRKDNTSGVKGVDWDKEDQKWKVRIQVNHKRVLVGRYSSFEDAIQARKEAEAKYHGEWAYHENNQLN